MKHRLLKCGIGLFLFTALSCNAISVTPTTGNDFLNDCPMSYVMQSWAKLQPRNPLTTEQGLDRLNTVATCISVAETAFNGAITHWRLAGHFNADCYSKYHRLDNINKAQKNDLLLKYLQESPADRHFGVTFNMLQALYKYYPVPAKCYEKITK